MNMQRSLVIVAASVGAVILVIVLAILSQGPAADAPLTEETATVSADAAPAETTTRPRPSSERTAVPGPAPSEPADEQGERSPDPGEAPSADAAAAEPHEEAGTRITFRLRGSLQYADTGTPAVGDLRVSLRATANGERRQTQSASADARGRFAVDFEDEPFALDDLYREVTFVMAEPRRPGESERWQAEAVVMVDPDKPVDVGVIRLRAGRGQATVTGRVVAADNGQPIAGAEVLLYDIMRRSPDMETSVAATTRTGPDGTYEFASVRDGRIAVAAMADGYAMRSSRPRAIRGDATVSIDLELAAGRMLTGRVVDAETDEPVQGAFLAVVQQQRPNAIAATAASDAAGAFELPGLGAGVWYLVAEARGYAIGFETVNVPAGRDDPVEPVTFRLRRGWTLSGRVVDQAGNPVPRYTIRAWPRGGVDQPSMQAEAIAQILAQAVRVEDEDGRFEISPLPDEGPHIVEVVDGDHARKIRRDVAVGPDAAEITLVLAAGGELAGRVLLGTSDAADEAQPLEGARVSLMRTIGTEQWSFPFHESGDVYTYAADNGDYSLSGLTAGRLHFRATHPDWGQVDFQATLTAGEVTEHDIVFSSDFARLVGTAYDAAGEPATGRLVLAVDQGSATRFDATTDGDGRFEFPPMPAGSYLVMLFDANFGEIEYNTFVQLESGERHEVDLRQPLDAVTVSGRVTMQGEPVAGASLLLTRDDGESSTEPILSTTDARGQFTARVQPGAYVALVQRHMPVPALHFRIEFEVPAVSEHTLIIDVPLATLVGRLVDASNNRPMEPGVELVLEPRSGRDGRDIEGLGDLLQRYAGQIRTREADGSFRWAGITPGTYRLRGYAEGYGLATADVTVSGSGDVEVPTLYFVRQATLNLSVTSASGGPVAGAMLTVIDSAGDNLTLIDSLVTDANGRAEVPFLRPNETYTIRAAAPGYAPGLVRHDTGAAIEASAAIVLSPGGALRVQVVDDFDEPVAGARVRLRDESGAVVPAILSQSELYGTPTRTGATGRVLRLSLVPGRYRVEVEHEGRTASVSVDVPVTGPGGEPTTITVRWP